ncbi:MAG: response regulator [Acetivibrionales bacterium]|jgi:two-component system chemotaxis response regulator CheY
MKRVLVVDDANFMRLKISKVLKDHGFEIAGEAADGKEGVKKYIELRPDMVTMDITMPEMSGIEALKAIREFDNQAKVLMISAMGQERLVLEAVASGAKSFIVKPFKDEQIVDAIKKILGL